MRFGFLLGMLISLPGIACTHDHKVDLNPEVFVRVSNVGNGQRVIVRVNDIRSQKAISKKESNLKVSSERSVNTVNIYPASSVRDTVADKIMEGFARMGFHPSRHGQSSDRRISVDIVQLRLNYRRSTERLDIPKIHAQMATILRVQARYNNQSFNKTYSSRRSKSHRILTGKFKNERLINNSLSMAIQKIFDDSELFQFLLPGKL